MKLAIHFLRTCRLLPSTAWLHTLSYLESPPVLVWVWWCLNIVSLETECGNVTWCSHFSQEQKVETWCEGTCCIFQLLLLADVQKLFVFYSPADLCVPKSSCPGCCCDVCHFLFATDRDSPILKKKVVKLMMLKQVQTAKITAVGNDFMTYFNLDCQAIIVFNCDKKKNHHYSWWRSQLNLQK